MTATALTLDVASTHRVPFGRLVRVELRKLADTRAGRWLLISIVALTLLVLVIQMAVVLGNDLHPKYVDFLQGANTPMGILLPVLGVLSITSEWSQRTAMVTFTLEPSRMRVVLAKMVSLLVVSVVAWMIGMALGALTNVVYGALSGDPVVWGNVGKLMVTYFLLFVLSLASGFALGALFLNSPAGIVVYFVYSFVLPIPFAIGAALMGWFDSLRPWVDFNFAQAPLIDGTIAGSDWAQLLTSGLIWLGLPLAIGLWRISRTEVK
jgi:ABC-type transport system involved in multi-copper enzyme maturation permease subunit